LAGAALVRYEPLQDISSGEGRIVLVELRLVEQRHQAVLEVLAGVSITSVALRYGVTRQTVHRWLRRYGAIGLSGLADSPSRPASCPHQMSPEVEARIITMRAEHPEWGPTTLGHELKEAGLEQVPGRSSIYRCLLRHGLITPEPRKRKRGDFRRWERSRSMELWQMDVMGGVRLQDGSELKLITGIDDHSRFCVAAKLVPRATARPVCEALAASLKRYGVPDQILTDNGKVFTGKFGPGSGEVLFDRICRENGIRHLLTAPRSPTTTGKVERFHKTVRTEFLKDRVFPSIAEAQAELDRWVERYNTRRPHQSLGMVAPIKRFALVATDPVEEHSAPAEKPEPPGPRRVTRVVGRDGRINLATFSYHVGVWLAGETVDVVLTNDGLLEIFHRGVLVKAHARRRPADSEPPLRVNRTSRSKPPSPEPAADFTLIRLVDPTGCVSFAGASYRVGKTFKRLQVEVRLVKDTVEFYLDGQCIRSHKAKHDPSKLYGAFANPSGRPRKAKAG
jgi:transposase InsO family protein